MPLKIVKPEAHPKVLLAASTDKSDEKLKQTGSYSKLRTSKPNIPTNHEKSDELLIN
jgi:hypothetical protein